MNNAPPPPIPPPPQPPIDPASAAYYAYYHQMQNMQNMQLAQSPYSYNTPPAPPAAVYPNFYAQQAWYSSPQPYPLQQTNASPVPTPTAPPADQPGSHPHSMAHTYIPTHLQSSVERPAYNPATSWRAMASRQKASLAQQMQTQPQKQPYSSPSSSSSSRLGLPPLADLYAKTLFKIAGSSSQDQSKASAWIIALHKRAEVQGKISDNFWWRDIEWPMWITRSEIPAEFTESAHNRPPRNPSTPTASKSKALPSISYASAANPTKPEKRTRSNRWDQSASEDDEPPSAKFSKTNIGGKAVSASGHTSFTKPKNKVILRDKSPTVGTRPAKRAKKNYVEPEPISPVHISDIESSSTSNNMHNGSNDSDDPETARRLARQARFNKDFNKELGERAKRETLRRKATEVQRRNILAGAQGNPDVIEWDEHTVVGTCTNLEKPYLRLTSAPDPSSIRPLHVLRQTLTLLKQNWKTEHNYAFVCDQFKSLRQDLTVQRIKNSFSVDVYENHARIALEKGDIGEYNQCQSQLKELYKLGLQGNEDEFISYRILYFILTRNRIESNALLTSLTSIQKSLRHTSFAIKVHKAIQNSDYYTLFNLIHDPVHSLAPYLIDQFIDRERLRAAKIIAKAYRPSVPLEWITLKLGFGSESNKVTKKDLQTCFEFLSSHACVFTRPHQPRHTNHLTTHNHRSSSSSSSTTNQLQHHLHALPIMKPVPIFPKSEKDIRSIVLDTKSSFSALGECLKKVESVIDIKGQIH